MSNEHVILACGFVRVPPFYKRPRERTQMMFDNKVNRIVLASIASQHDVSNTALDLFLAI